MTTRADLTGGQKAVAETLDEVNFRMHGLTSSGSYHQEFIDWLGERGYCVAPAGELERLRAADWPARLRAAAAEAHRGRNYAAQFHLMSLAGHMETGDPDVADAIARALFGATSR